MPSQREKTDFVQLKIRLKEELRAKIEMAAHNSSVSLNGEAVQRLEQSFLDEERIFKDANMMALIQLLVGTVRMIEARTGTKWTENEQCRNAVATTVIGFLTDESGVPFHKPPAKDGNGDVVDFQGIWEAPRAAIDEAVHGMLKMRGVSDQTIEMINRLIETDSKPSGA